MFVESLVIVASACSSGACQAPVKATATYQYKVEPSVKQYAYSEWTTIHRPCKVYPLVRRSAQHIQVFSFPSQRVCTKGCK